MNGDEEQYIESELKRYGNGDRLSYYTKLEFKIFDSSTGSLNAKVDTGSPYTVIRLDNRGIIKLNKNEIIKNGVLVKNKVSDATGNSLKLYGYIVDDFKLTDEIKFDKIKIYFSENIKEEAILGMDVLSLFSFKYIQEKDMLKGSFWVMNYDRTFDRISIRRKNDGYYNPRSIMGISDLKK